MSEPPNWRLNLPTCGGRPITIAPAALALALLSQVPDTPATRILGTWRGTSICVDRQVDRACRDEEVIYEIDSASSPRGPVRMRADKILSGVRQPMGVLRLSFDSATHIWSAELTTRFHGRWSFEVKGDVMEGSLKELPTERLVRHVNTRRAHEP